MYKPAQEVSLGKLTSSIRPVRRGAGNAWGANASLSKIKKKDW